MKKIIPTKGYIIINTERTALIRKKGFLEIYDSGIKILTLNNEKDIKEFMEAFDKEFKKYDVDNTKVSTEKSAK